MGTRGCRDWDGCASEGLPCPQALKFKQVAVTQEARRMVDRLADFAIEDLSVRGAIKTRLAKSFADAARVGVARLERFQRSPGVCLDCGWIGPRLRPGIDAWIGGGCGMIHDHDIEPGDPAGCDGGASRRGGAGNLSPL